MDNSGRGLACVGTLLWIPRIAEVHAIHGERNQTRRNVERRRFRADICVESEPFFLEGYS